MGVPRRYFELAEAREMAGDLCQALAPSCERIQVAGEIRRGCPDIRSIDLVAISALLPGGVFRIVSCSTIFALEESLGQMIAYDRRARRFRGEVWEPRYKRFQWEGLSVELRIVLQPADWGVILAMQTGLPDFCHWLATPKERGGALPEGYRIFGGQLWAWDEPVPTPTEESFFEAIGVPFLAPEERAQFLNSTTKHGGPDGQARSDSADG